MRTRRLPHSDLDVSVVGLGCNNFGGRIDEPASRAVIDAALDAGITFLDTADIYGDAGGSEEIIGRALAGRRDRVVVATKFGSDLGDGEAARGARPYIRKAVEASLRRLQTDWIDLYQYHRPDGVTPVEETLEALDELVQEGLVRAIGSSNFSAALVEEAHDAAERRGLTPFSTEQSRYSWLRREAEEELIPVSERLGIGFIPYFPLASGLLTGKYRRGQPAPEGSRLQGRELDDADLERVDRLQELAHERGVTLLDLAIGGLAAQPAVVSVIAGATRPEQVRANAAAGEWEPGADDLAALRSLRAEEKPARSGKGA
ncbi:MAG TPA: aldo/keto reductase [Gaiellaceae bacterium]|jgi:aryl-alcohol dehydrogenase-like predicted oxidoreductase